MQRAEYAKEADKLKLTVTDEEIQARINQVKKQYFGGSQAKLDAQLKAQGYTTGVDSAPTSRRSCSRRRSTPG